MPKRVNAGGGILKNYQQIDKILFPAPLWGELIKDVYPQI
ncbi:MAG: hypothetical protein CM15mP81_15770 [Alphaproteobacteria bacterium]|nr:MAG: hypothetical protein CM15mP81_15770 [Alphaproteobacteria bacterium]